MHAGQPKIQEDACRMVYKTSHKRSRSKKSQLKEWINLLVWLLSPTCSAEVSTTVSKGLLNHWAKSSEELKMLGSKKFKRAHSSSKLFCTDKITINCLKFLQNITSTFCKHLLGRKIPELESLWVVAYCCFDNVAALHWVCRTHSLCGDLHQW